MKKAFIAYYSFGEIEKVAQRIEKKLLEQEISSEIFLIEDKRRFSLKEQFKKEKELELNKVIPFLNDIDYLFVGSPVISFSSAPIVNTFLKGLDEKELLHKKVYLFATGIGLPGSAIKKMRGVLSMKGIEVTADKVFSSIFHFDEKKLKEVDEFINKKMVK
jgi:flavorubredoxin